MAGVESELGFALRQQVKRCKYLAMVCYLAGSWYLTLNGQAAPRRALGGGALPGGFLTSYLITEVSVYFRLLPFYFVERGLHSSLLTY